MGRKRAEMAVRELVTGGRSSTLGLFDLDVTGDAAALAELAAVILLRLAAATGRDPQVLLDDTVRDLARRGSRPRA
jgi:hypothetical protein